MKRAPITFETTPETSAERPPKPKAQKAARSPAKNAAAVSEGADDMEMLSARVNKAIARQFRSLAKLRGEKVQSLLQTALSEYLERNRF